MMMTVLAAFLNVAWHGRGACSVVVKFLSSRLFSLSKLCTTVEVAASKLLGEGERNMV